MIENYLRPLYQLKFVDPVAMWCGRYISANGVTFLACLSGVAIFPALYFNQSLLAIVLLLISGYLDTLDGTIARLRNEASNLGTLYDILSDRIVEAAIIMGIFTVAPVSRALMSICMLSSVLICVTSFLVVGIFTPNHSNKGFHYSPGLMERAEAFFFFGLMICLPKCFFALSTTFCFLVVLTAIIRVAQYRENANANR
jgi:phosphatidylglycerophosphate synthase